MEQQDLERIARAALKELGVPAVDLSVHADERPGHWRIEIKGSRTGPGTLRVACGKGSSPQWVRSQILDQFTQ